MFKENFNSLETRVETENSAEPKNERQELLEEILAIKNLPVEKLINRYKSFDIDEGFIGGKSLSKEDAIVVLNLIEDNSGYEEISEEKMAYDYLSELFSDQIENPRYAINSLKKWIEEDQDRIKVVTEKVISLLKSKKKTTINLFIFLAEIDVYRQEKLMTDDGKILAELDRVLNSSLMHFANSYIDQMAVLNRLNNKRANFELHKILDFVRDFMADSQNFVGGSDELLYYFERFAEGEIDFANNYLLKQHLKEIIEIRNLSWSEKEDFVNIPGGNTDQTIYSYKHARESYENRIKFGINKGYPLRSLVLPISDELFGTYQDGKFWGIIEETDQDFSTRIQSYIKQNKPDDNFIYGQLNQEPNLPPNYVNKYEIHQRKVLLNFEIHKKAEEGEFFFDLSLLNWDIIDPVIRGSILTYNQMYLHTKEDQVNKTGTIPEEELKNIIFPLKNYSEEEEYNYEYLMSLSMRKKIEDDFGLKMEEFSLWEQRNFLSYLERASIEKVEEIKKFIKDFDHDGIKGFLSVEYGIEMGEKILDIGKGNPERAKAIFKDYSQIIDFAEDFNRAVLPAIQAASHKGFDKQIFFNSLMYQGKQFLHFCFDYIQQRPQASYHEIYTEVAKEHSSLDPKNCAEGIAGGAIVELVNQVGLERARAIFNRAFNETDDSVIKEQIERALSFIVLPSTKPIHSLQDFYQNIIDFSQYAYPTQDFEEDFLQKHIEKKDKTLDLGSGTGRLAVPLINKGLDVTALDYTGKHVKMVKEKAPQAKVLQGDWTKVGLADASFDKIYSLGRNILHEVTEERQNQLFSEANRVLKGGGLFIIDIPDRNKGFYKKLIDTHKEIMKSRGITNFREDGLTYDSPDDVHFDTRYVYSHEDIEALATENGFEIIEHQETENNNGYGDVNVYYVLKKIGASQKAPVESISETTPFEKAA